MLTVDTEVRPSRLHGLGVFLREPVKAGALIWRFDGRIDSVFGSEEIEGLPDHMREYLRVYTTWHAASGLYVLCGDNGRYVNHSDEPSTLSRGVSFGDDVAARDLPAGAELTSDYRTICDLHRLNGVSFAPRDAVASGAGRHPAQPSVHRLVLESGGTA